MKSYKEASIVRGVAGMVALLSKIIPKTSLFGAIGAAAALSMGALENKEISMATQVSDASFEELLQSGQPVLLDLWAPWCGPCRALGPVIDELAQEYEGRVAIVKMNVDENPATPTKYRVQSVPTLILFKNGEEVDRKIGNVAKDVLKEFLDSKALA